MDILPQNGDRRGLVGLFVALGFAEKTQERKPKILYRIKQLGRSIKKNSEEKK